MMTTTEPISHAFHTFLLSKFEGDDDEALAVLQRLEQELPSVLNDYFGAGLSDIYALTDPAAISDYRNRIANEPAISSQNRNVDPSYTEVLKWYRLFLKHQQATPQPMPVPGETGGDQADAGQGDVAADPLPPTPLPQKAETIFMEGDEAESHLPETYRRRNRELRDACIAYYRTKHDGHCVCECCGFEFKSFYGIDDDYIEVHHKTPFAQVSNERGEHLVDATRDLVPLCANCHRMIHRMVQGPPGSCMPWEEFRKKFQEHRNQNL